MSAPRRRFGETARPTATASRRRNLIDRIADEAAPSPVAAPSPAPAAARRKRKPRFVL